MSKSKKKVKKQNNEKEAKFDKFNRRLGTQGALIDTKLSKTPKSVEQLAKECKLPVGRIRTHVRDLTSKGFIKKDKDGKFSIK